MIFSTVPGRVVEGFSLIGASEVFIKTHFHRAAQLFLRVAVEVCVISQNPRRSDEN
jgi:hypothetical protein